MLSETFLNLCYDLILAKKQRALETFTFQEIKSCLDFYQKAEGEDIPVTCRGKFDLLKKTCEVILQGGDLNQMKISVETSDKYRHLRDYILTKSDMALDEKGQNERLRVVHQMAAWIQISRKNTKWKECIEKIRDGNIETLEEAVGEYQGLVKSSFKDIMDYETKSSRNLVSSLNVPNDNLTAIIEEVKKKYSKQNVIPSGIRELDEEFLFGGFQPSRVYMFGGTSGVGKSILLLNFATRGAMSNPLSDFPFFQISPDDCLSSGPERVFLYVTLENYAYETWMRLYCSLLRKTKGEMLDTLNDPSASKNTQDEINKILRPYNCSIQVEYFSSGSISPMDIAALIQKYSMNPWQRAVKAVYIDYLDLLRPDEKNEFYRLDLGAITSSLKTIAGAFEIPIITATQLNREAYRKEGSKDPGMEMISESIQKVFIADFGAIIKKDDSGQDHSNGDYPAKPVKVIMKVEKNRDGRLGKTEIYLDYQRSRMMTKEEYQKECEAVMEI